MSDEEIADRPTLRRGRSRLPRIIGGFAGIALLPVVAIAFLVAHELIVVGNHGGAAAEEAIGSGWAYRLTHSLLGSGTSELHGFEALALVAGSAGLLALAVSVPRRPHSRWPEILWVFAAVLASVPALSFHLWLFVSLPWAGLVGCAAMVHGLRRREVTVSRTLGAARAASEALSPQVATTLDRGTAAALSAASLSARGARFGARASRTTVTSVAHASRLRWERRKAGRSPDGV